MSYEAIDAPRRNVRLLKAADMLANELRAEILEDDLKQGDPLPSESELIARHGLSRGTVREALRLLEAEGYIQIQRGPRGGITVRHPNQDLVSRSLATLLTLGAAPLRGLFEFRKLIEPAAAAAAARDATDEQRQALLRMVDPASRNRGAAVFHRLVAEAVGNEMTRTILGATNRIVDWHARLEQVATDDFESAGVAHERIARAIVDGRADAASRAMLRHIEAWESVMRDAGHLDQPILPRARWVEYLRQGMPN